MAERRALATLIENAIRQEMTYLNLTFSFQPYEIIPKLTDPLPFFLSKPYHLQLPLISLARLLYFARNIELLPIIV